MSSWLNADSQMQAQAANREFSFAPFALDVPDRRAEADAALQEYLAGLQEQEPQEQTMPQQPLPAMPQQPSSELGDLHRRLKMLGLGHDQGTIDELTGRPERDRQFQQKKDDAELASQQRMWDELAQQYNLVDSQMQENSRALQNIYAAELSAGIRRDRGDVSPYQNEVDRLAERDAALQSRKSKIEQMIADKQLPQTKTVLPDQTAAAAPAQNAPIDDSAYIEEVSRAIAATAPIFAKSGNNMTVAQMRGELNKLGLPSDERYAKNILDNHKQLVEGMTAEEKRKLDLEGARRGDRIGKLEETEKNRDIAGKKNEALQAMNAAAAYLANPSNENAQAFIAVNNKFYNALDKQERKGLMAITANLSSINHAELKTQAQATIDNLKSKYGGKK